MHRPVPQTGRVDHATGFHADHAIRRVHNIEAFRAGILRGCRFDRTDEIRQRDPPREGQFLAPRGFGHSEARGGLRPREFTAPAADTGKQLAKLLAALGETGPHDAFKGLRVTRGQFALRPGCQGNQRRIHFRLRQEHARGQDLEQLHPPAPPDDDAEDAVILRPRTRRRQSASSRWSKNTAFRAGEACEVK